MDEKMKGSMSTYEEIEALIIELFHVNKVSIAVGMSTLITMYVKYFIISTGDYNQLCESLDSIKKDGKLMHDIIEKNKGKRAD